MRLHSIVILEQKNFIIFIFTIIEMSISYRAKEKEKEREREIGTNHN